MFLLLFSSQITYELLFLFECFLQFQLLEGKRFSRDLKIIFNFNKVQLSFHIEHKLGIGKQIIAFVWTHLMAFQVETVKAGNLILNGGNKSHFMRKHKYPRFVFFSHYFANKQNFHSTYTNLERFPTDIPGWKRRNLAGRRQSKKKENFPGRIRHRYIYVYIPTKIEYHMCVCEM